LNPKGATPDQLLVQTDAEGPEIFDGFGLSLAAGDFNGDGFSDLAVGANGEDVGIDGNNEGSVSVFYGSKSGLAKTAAQYLTEAVPTDSAQFGFFVAAGDFNGDGRDDLAVGLLNKMVGTAAGAGAVLLYPGSSAGLATDAVRQLDQDSPNTHNKAEAGDQFGSVMAVGDVNRDGRDDLAVSAPAERVNGNSLAGAVSLFFGCSSGANCNGLLDTKDQYITQDMPGVMDTAEKGDFFGIALAMADFGKGSGADLAVGIFGEDISGLKDNGAVAVFYSDGNRLATSSSQLFTPGTGGVPGVPSVTDEFGATLAAGNIGKGAQADLVIGAPFTDIDGMVDAGTVTVLYGTSQGLTTAGAERLTQDSPGIPSATAASFGFGKTLVVADFGRSGQDDLAIGSRDTVDGVPTAGAVTILYGGTGKIGASADPQYLTQNSPGMEDSAEANDLFGGVWGQPGLAG
jgi:hypothetical protein